MLSCWIHRMNGLRSGVTIGSLLCNPPSKELRSSVSALSPYRPFYVTGPTGSGKSDLALELARITGGEVVNADAFQLYRGLPILTACPSPQAYREVPHHLYEVLGPEESCDAGRYLALATPVLAEISARGRVPIVVGGSGLYLKALTHGLGEPPPSQAALRGCLDQLSRGELSQILARIDPVSAATIEPANRRYRQRAVEISLLARRPASTLREAWTSDPVGLRGILVTRQRDELHTRILRRAQAMLEGGAIAEVTDIAAWSGTASKAIGVREIQAFLRGEMDREACALAIAIATRQYAKRQRPWFRREQWLTTWDADLPPTAMEIARLVGLS